MTREDLIAFEAEVAERFNRAEIRAPIHLDGGNEDELIRIFEQIGFLDYVCCSWRSHYKALLHGIPRDEVMAEIVAGRSISLCFPEHNFISSAIVGGILPIALGIAWSIKRAGGREQVWAFLGDMAACGGMFAECHRYAAGHDLPITFVIENNKMSVCTPTSDAWGSAVVDDSRVEEYSYDLPWPHSGAGKRVEF